MGEKKTPCPWATFTDPEVAHVGLTQAQAEKEVKGMQVKCISMSGVDRAVCDSAEGGLIKVVLDKKGFIVGATIVGPRAGEMIAELQVAMYAKKKFTALANVIHAYPSFSFGVYSMAGEMVYEQVGRSKLFQTLVKGPR